jgi:hypothetical protein
VEHVNRHLLRHFRRESRNFQSKVDEKQSFACREEIFLGQAGMLQLPEVATHLDNDGSRSLHCHGRHDVGLGGLLDLVPAHRHDGAGSGFNAEHGNHLAGGDDGDAAGHSVVLLLVGHVGHVVGGLVGDLLSRLSLVELSIEEVQLALRLLTELAIGVQVAEELSEAVKALPAVVKCITLDGDGLQLGLGGGELMSERRGVERRHHDVLLLGWLLLGLAVGEGEVGTSSLVHYMELVDVSEEIPDLSHADDADAAPAVVDSEAGQGKGSLTSHALASLEGLDHLVGDGDLLLPGVVLAQVGNARVLGPVQ